MNNLFRDTYPDIEFIEPGMSANNIHAMYKIGWFYKDGEFDVAKNPNDFRKEPLQKTSSDISYQSPISYYNTIHYVLELKKE